jgi:hypothetical protein
MATNSTPCKWENIVEKSNANPAAAALIADGVLFKASGKLEKAMQPFRDVYGNMSEEEITQMMSGVNIVYQPQRR